MSTISSLQVQRQLGISTDKLATISERLPSGLRINRASDDAAGLAISVSLSNQRSLSTKAIQNLSDGVSMISIMSGALEQQKIIVTRLSELAQQSANGTLSDKQRSTLSVEYEALVKEFGRIGDSTKFNGMNLLHAVRSPEFSKFLLQAGIDGTTSSLLTINTTETGTLSGILDISQVLSSAFPVLAQPPPPSGTLSQILSVSNEFIKTQVVDNAGASHEAYIFYYDVAGFYSTPAIRIYVKAEETDGTVSSTPEDWVALIDSTTADVYSEGTYNLDGTVAFNSSFGGLANGRSVVLNNFTLGAIQVSDTQNEVPFVSDKGGKTSLEATGIEIVSRALDAIDTTRRRLEELGNFSGQLGAYEKRLETAISNLTNQRLNYAQAQSRIMDADIAEETANYVSTKIRQQAAIAILAQTNNSSKLVLGLLNEQE